MWTLSTACPILAVHFSTCELLGDVTFCLCMSLMDVCFSHCWNDLEFLKCSQGHQGVYLYITYIYLLVLWYAYIFKGVKWSYFLKSRSQSLYGAAYCVWFNLGHWKLCHESKIVLLCFKTLCWIPFSAGFSASLDDAGHMLLVVPLG